MQWALFNNFLIALVILFLLQVHCKMAGVAIGAHAKVVESSQVACCIT